MLAAPHDFARQISAGVGLDWTEHEADLRCWSQRVQNSNNEHFIEAKTSRTYSRLDHKYRIDRWKENLTMDEINEALLIIGKTASVFGYQMPDSF